MYNRSISFKVLFINDAIICRQTISNQLNIMLPCADINCLCDEACEVA